MTDVRTQRCEWEDCAEYAQGYVEAQWSIADFVRYEMCIRHMIEGRDELSKRMVDGMPAVTRSQLYW
jgi:hypothetical protein